MTEPLAEVNALQAISVIVTHRTDDDSKLPALLPAAEPQKAASAAKEPKKLKLRLQNAPAKDLSLPLEEAPAFGAPQPAHDESDDNDWENVASVCPSRFSSQAKK